MVNIESPRKLLAIVLLCAACRTPIDDRQTSAAPMPPPLWPAELHDAQRTSRSEHLGPRNLDIRRIIAVDPGVDVPLSLAIGGDGTIYLEAPNAVVAFDPTSGAARWRAEIPSPSLIAQAIALAPDGRVIVVTMGSGSAPYGPTAIRALDGASGSTLWLQPTPNCIGATSLSNDAIYQTCEDGTVTRRSWVDGSLQWTSQTGTKAGLHVLESDGAPIVDSDHGLLSFDPADGHVQWHAPPLDWVYLAGDDGTIYAGSFPMVAFGPRDGQVHWSLRGYVPLALAPDDSLRAVDPNHSLIASLSRPGKVNWSLALPAFPGFVIEQLAVDGEGTTFAISAGGTSWLHRISSDGRLLETRQMDDSGRYSLAIGADRTLVVLSGGYHRLYVIGTE